MLGFILKGRTGGCACNSRYLDVVSLLSNAAVIRDSERGSSGTVIAARGCPFPPV